MGVNAGPLPTVVVAEGTPLVKGGPLVGEAFSKPGAPEGPDGVLVEVPFGLRTLFVVSIDIMKFGNVLTHLSTTWMTPLATNMLGWTMAAELTNIVPSLAKVKVILVPVVVIQSAWSIVVV